MSVFGPWLAIVAGSLGYALAFSWQLSHSGSLPIIIKWGVLMPLVWIPSTIPLIWGLHSLSGGRMFVGILAFSLVYNIVVTGIALLSERSIHLSTLAALGLYTTAFFVAQSGK